MQFPRLALALLFVTLLSASEANPPARFTDPQRVQKLETALPEIDAIFRRFASTRKITGMVWGVVLEADSGTSVDATRMLAVGNERFILHVASMGVRDRATGEPVDAGTVFRIASMTKSFTALAILKLRDEGKLSLEDPVAKWIPEFAQMPLPTRDSAPLRIRNLLSHSSGFPEDNPWGDQQLSASNEDLTRWLKLGIPFSTPPDTRYEYSNYAFGLLGRVVTRASGVPYDRYVQREILDKLGMSSSTFEFSSIPAAKRATGYRLKPNGTYQAELPLPHGAFGSMGGLLTTSPPGPRVMMPKQGRCAARRCAKCSTCGARGTCPSPILADTCKPPAAATDMACASAALAALNR
jgi:CubicO group peptidase (beta-lactamase class C family)